jgi:hypothetical protein
VDQVDVQVVRSELRKGGVEVGLDVLGSVRVVPEL